MHILVKGTVPKEEEEELYFCMLERWSFDKMAGGTQNGEG